MRILFRILILFCFLTACAAPVSSSPPSPLAPTSDPTSVPATQTVTFSTPDGAAIDGTLYGSGDTTVIFSVMGNCKRGWEDMADLVARNDMTALTYQWRGCGDTGSVEEYEIQKFVDDLRGAINFMREQGAKKIILVGASLGGCASAKLAVESQADGLIVVASPPEIAEWGFVIEQADLNTDIAKLFITAENDTTVSASATRELFELAAELKEWQTYPGNAHGTDLFEGAHGDEVEERILKFILQIHTDGK